MKRKQASDQVSAASRVADAGSPNADSMVVEKEEEAMVEDEVEDESGARAAATEATVWVESDRPIVRLAADY